MKKGSYSKTYKVNQSPGEVFQAILNVRGWWAGLYGETIEGNSEKIDDEFTFRAGGGMHYSKQRLVELVQDKKIVWLVVESNLSFLENLSEWTETKISFEISDEDGQTTVKFIHDGLVPQFECYGDCTGAWSQYLNKFLLPIRA